MGFTSMPVVHETRGNRVGTGGLPEMSQSMSKP